MAMTTSISTNVKPSRSPLFISIGPFRRYMVTGDCYVSLPNGPTDDEERAKDGRIGTLG